MHGTRLGFVAAAVLVAGLGGCSLPQVLPLEGGTHAGPSPYGVWYEQHWATNSVLLAAADQPEETVDVTTEEVSVEVEADANVTLGTEESEAEEAVEEARRAAEEAENAALEASTAPKPAAAADVTTEAEDFDESSPYQFPASSFQPAPKHSAQPDGSIRY